MTFFIDECYKREFLEEYPEEIEAAVVDDMYIKSLFTYLAITPPRARFNRGFLLSICVIFLFYIIRAFSISLGEGGTIPPLLSAWIPNILLGVLGWFLYKNKAYKI